MLISVLNGCSSQVRSVGNFSTKHKWQKRKDSDVGSDISKFLNAQGSASMLSIASTYTGLHKSHVG